MCYKSFTQSKESIKNVVGGGFPKEWDCLATHTFPACPSINRGEFSPERLSGVLGHLGSFANTNASWAGKGSGNRIFSSSHFLKKVSGFLRLLCFNIKS